MNTNRRRPGYRAAATCALWLAISLQLSAFMPYSAIGRQSTGYSTAPVLAQDDESGDEAEVPPDQVEKYIAVYKAMQHDRSLTAEQAAAQQGLTLQAFRQLEDKIERDDAAREHVRDELQAAASASPSPIPGSHASPGTSKAH